MRLSMIKKSERTNSAGYGGGALWGAAAAGAFFGTALVLTVVAYVFGSLIGITPEFPMLFSYTFLLSAFLAIVFLPAVGALANLFKAATASPLAIVTAGGAGGVLLAALIWLITVGSAANPVDWPYLLYFLQLGESWALAGAVLATGAAYRHLTGSDEERIVWMASAVRQLLSCTLIMLILLPLPFLPLWLAKRSFGIRAVETASEKIRIPSGINLAVKDADVPGDSFESNRRYRAGGEWESGGSDFSLVVDGERHGYEVEIMDLRGSVKNPSVAGSGPVDWQSTSSQGTTVMAIAQAAREYFSVPLSYKKATTAPDIAVYLMGDGLTVVARPLDPSRQDAGVLFSFSALAP